VLNPQRRRNNSSREQSSFITLEQQPLASRSLVVKITGREWVIVSKFQGKGELLLHNREREDCSQRDSLGHLIILSCAIMEVKGKWHQFNKIVFNSTLKKRGFLFLYKSGANFSTCFYVPPIPYINFTLNMN
jgi:hypothetical protein